MKKYSILILLLWCINEALACTSAVVLPYRTTTGEVIMWKNRDNSTRRTQVKSYTGGKYAYTALVNSTGGGFYGALNTTGFGIISNAVDNLPVTEDKGITSNPESYGLMTTAARECASVAEFEALLKRYLPRKDGYQQMLCVCDAQGNGAWFEVTNSSYVRYDATKATDGYLLRSNFGFSGDANNRGTSIRRYNLMTRRLNEHKEPFSVQDFVDYSRSFYTISQGDILLNDKEYTDASYTVNRYSTCAEIIIVSGKNPRVFFINGNPIAGMATVVYPGKTVPECLKLDGEMYQNSEKYLSQAYTQKSSSYIMNKPIVREMSKLTYDVYDPGPMPANASQLTAELDARYKVQSRKINNVLQGINVGDLNNDANYNVGDVTKLISLIMSNYVTQDKMFFSGDMNYDGSLNVGDITELISKILDN